MKLVGLTGSIAMGKSTTAQMFKDAGIPVFDSDAAVHAFYRSKDAQVLAEIFPGVLVNGEVNRQVLSKYVIGNPDNMRKLEIGCASCRGENAA